MTRRWRCRGARVITAVLVSGASLAVAACGSAADASEPVDTGLAVELPPETGSLGETDTIEEPPASEPGLELPADVLLREDSTGPEVMALERALVELGYDPGPVDQTFTKATRTAVTAFQRDHDLDQDGIVGPMTAAAIDEALQQLPSEG